jgi:regulator of RNase E activity RraA
VRTHNALVSLASGEMDATINDMKEAPVKVTLTEPAVAGDYVVAEQRDDGTLVLRPESSEEVIEQFADRRLSEEEFLESLDRLHAAKLREEDRR